jgi:broad specificity phosphatase PhoE
MTTLVDLIRHGTPEGGNRYRGHNIDDPLSEKGWQQMWSAVSGYPPWDMIVSSPLQRCLAFATAYAEKYRLNVRVDDRLKEIGFGSWEGYSSEQILEKDPEAIRNFYHDPVTNRPEGAEELAVFQRRVGAAIESIFDTHKDQRILVVAHAGVMRAAVTATLKAPEASMYRISIGNASIIRIKHDGIRPPTVTL